MSVSNIEGVPDLAVDKTFVYLVAGLARSDTKTAKKYLQGEEVGRTEGERGAMRSMFDTATREAVALRRAENPRDKEDEVFGRALGKAAARFRKDGEG